MPTLILDNGAHAIKAAWHSRKKPPSVFANSVIRGAIDKRILVSNEADRVTSVAGVVYRSPFDRGFLTNWEAQKVIWDYVFSEANLNVHQPSTTTVVLTEPVFNLPSIQACYDQMIFEGYRFDRFVRMPAPQLATFSKDLEPSECHLVVDSGHSFTHIVPFHNHRPIEEAIRRVNVGGKMLTNVLKETISFRHYNVINETMLVNLIKERTTFVSNSVDRDLAMCKEHPNDPNANSILQYYVLPDGMHEVYGHVKEDMSAMDPDEQLLPMNHERFMIPELLFTPSDIGMDQGGIAEAVADSLASVPSELMPVLMGNVVLIGGNCALPGFKARFERDVRPLLDDDLELRVHIPDDPVRFAARAGCGLTDADIKEFGISRKEYLEHGSGAWAKRGLARAPPSIQGGQYSGAGVVSGIEDGSAFFSPATGTAGLGIGRARVINYAEDSDEDDFIPEDSGEQRQVRPKLSKGRASVTQSK